MSEPILRAIEEVWRKHRTALDEALTCAVGDLQDLLRLDEYHRHGHDPDQLQSALGPLATSHLDLASLSRLLDKSKGSRAMNPERLRRVQKLIPAIETMKVTWSNATLEAARIDLDEPEDEIRERAEEHFNRLAEVFRAVRTTQLEIRSKYDAGSHDAAFATFDWRDLGPGELRSCPFFLVTAALAGDDRRHLQKILSLLETGLPLKVIAVRSSLRRTVGGGSAQRVPSTMTLETLPLAMRGVYFLQTPATGHDFEQRLHEALAAPRPGIISILSPRQGEEPADFQSRAERARRARAFPACVYDPDRADRFVQCFDLSSNPSTDAAWTTQALAGADEEGRVTELEEPFTFAHFAASEPDLCEELTEPPPNAEPLVALTDYVALTRAQRRGKLPFISLVDADGNIVRKVVSPTLTLQCAERLHLWRTLQELSGADNPHVNAARAQIENELHQKQETELQSLRQEMTNAAAERERAAVASTVRKLVARLTGAEPSSN